MASVRVAERYSKSLLDLAKETDSVEQVYGDMQQFYGALKSRDMKNLLKSPVIKGPVKYGIIKKLFGEQWQKVTLKFFEVVIRKDRADALDQIAETFFEQYNEYKGVTHVKVISAQPLEQEALEKIEQKLLESGTTRPNVVLVKEVDPSLIGGFVLEYNNNRYDSSVKTKLGNLRKKLIH